VDSGLERFHCIWWF